MDRLLDRAKNGFDKYQQKHPALGFPVAVVKRYTDDQAGKQAALVTYYAFLSIFPLLLIFMTVLNFLVSSNPELRGEISQQAFQYFPALGNSLQSSVTTLKSSGIALVLELLVLLYGARGLAAILQETFNNVWHVDKEHRPGFWADHLRSIAMMASVGGGIVISTVLSFLLSHVLDIGTAGRLLLTLLNLAVIYGLFLAVFRLGTSNRIRFHWLIPGALIAGTGVLLVQHFGTYFMSMHLSKLESNYGSFAITLGMMFWIYLQAQIILYSLEITAVRAQKDWPKKLFDAKNDAKKTINKTPK